MASPKTSTAQGRRFHSSPIEENFESRNIKATQQATHQQKKSESQRDDRRSGKKFYELMNPRLILIKVMEKPNYDYEPNHLLSMVEAASWLGLLWLLPKKARSYLLMMKLMMLAAV